MKIHLLIFVLSFLIVGCWSDVQVSVDEKDGYNISINDQVWLRSSHTAIYIDDKWYSSDVNTLSLKEITYSWNETQLNYDLVHNGTHRKIVGSIR